jgi:GNAT superfamily N-acetyltransferase
VAVRVERVAAAVTFPLRQRVLRPHEALHDLALPGDDDPDTAHFAATEDGEVVATASVRREPPPWPVAPRASWRLRGMATAERRRGQGLGTSLLAAVIEHVGRHGGGLLWCNARVPAVPFYERAGFVTRGDPWTDAVIGPHVAMERAVEGRPGCAP